ncbi:hypothetical protein FGO68_gene9396 [Halteria grandinella]|uniref:HD domain-containing protein n=1 Tax=Halteria grandinella TaxID=5974 RepID=A0A8J8NU80_HALGN|nr:hypothetical protein FGO68_gene9396 [Halteria grandinella]
MFQQTLQIIDFVKQSTKQFDDSHNHEHALAVFQNAMDIVEHEDDFPEIDIDLIIQSSLLHDVRDHKYPNSISLEDLQQFLNSITRSNSVADKVLKIIDNVSFSKEDKKRKGLKPLTIFEPHFQKHLDIVRDADRLEAIGQIGIERCLQYAEAKGLNVKQDLVKHFNEKLSRVYTEGFIVTKRGRELATPKHQYMVDFISQYN